jgi:hypothetical protein
MKRRSAIALLLFLPLGGCAELEALLRAQAPQNTGASTTLDAGTAAAGLKQALEQGTQQAVATLGRQNGYFGNPRAKIPLPENLAKLDRALRKVGQAKAADEFVLSLNRAAEAAAPEAKAIFLQVIRQMSVKDAIGIVRGPDDAATRYFRERAHGTLEKKFRPIVASATDQVGVTNRYKRLLRDAGPAAPFLDVRSLDIDDYVTRKALDGLFLVVADEERRIRQDPVARTTDLLRKVFGNRGV